mmetsp:Transcript_110771/g.320085  ORF Transcript_110771/g.320085 Transcript_110771/m.320085 type:complete len:165 (-) Transcript_110771:89-583(-)
MAVAMFPTFCRPCAAQRWAQRFVVSLAAAAAVSAAVVLLVGPAAQPRAGSSRPRFLRRETRPDLGGGCSQISEDLRPPLLKENRAAAIALAEAETTPAVRPEHWGRGIRRAAPRAAKPSQKISALHAVVAAAFAVMALFGFAQQAKGMASVLQALCSAQAAGKK